MFLHYHYVCHHKFELPYVIDPEDSEKKRCPICHHDFSHIRKINCRGCNTVYYADDSYQIGDEFICPINGEPVKRVDINITQTPTPPNGTSTPNQSWLDNLGALIAIIFAIVIICQICTYLTTPTEPVAAPPVTINPPLNNIFENLPRIIRMIGEFLLIVTTLVVIYVLLRTAAVTPANSFSKVFDSAQNNPQDHTLLA